VAACIVRHEAECGRVRNDKYPMKIKMKTYYINAVCIKLGTGQKLKTVFSLLDSYSV
jgi:hypothetical protein